MVLSPKSDPGKEDGAISLTATAPFISCQCIPDVWGLEACEEDVKKWEGNERGKQERNIFCREEFIFVRVRL